jgi:hypothetical protein
MHAGFPYLSIEPYKWEKQNGEVPEKRNRISPQEVVLRVVQHREKQYVLNRE